MIGFEKSIFFTVRSSLLSLFLLVITGIVSSCNGNASAGNIGRSSEKSASMTTAQTTDPFESLVRILVSPEKPIAGEPFRIFAAGGTGLNKTKIVVSGPSGGLKASVSRNSVEIPFWKLEDFDGVNAGNYTVKLVSGNTIISSIEFAVSLPAKPAKPVRAWEVKQGWNNSYELLYSAWISSLFQGYGEDASWTALHEILRNRNQNFLYDYLSLDEDNPASPDKIVMQPDCADNPFFLRAYFAWKLGLPFGYHICDRGYVGKNPKAGQWITNANVTSGTRPVQAFNNFLRRVMNEVHSGTARTALDDGNSDYYPVPLERTALHPGTVFADPYGHTFVLVSWVPQTKDHPGLLLAVDAQPDGTVAVKRFWEGNFLFNTSEVIGEPGFKAFRPILVENGTLRPMTNSELVGSKGFVPFSMQQKKMETATFYRKMAHLINPSPLDAETALLNQIQALHEQLQVRVNSVANGEKYMKQHPGQIIPMPSNATGIFQAGGQWEDFSTPNRDLRLLIAIDAVQEFPDLIVRSPGDYDLSGFSSPEKAREKLHSILEKKSSELTITYIRSDGSSWKLTLGEIISRKNSFEVAYNPNDGIEIRWGAPEGSVERSTCHRSAPQNQKATMNTVRKWFHSRLHPPT